MVTTYSEATKLIREVARRKTARFAEDGESIPIRLAAGRTCCKSYYSPESTPQFDTSAMDGFAVDSSTTANASAEEPLILRIVGTIAAGDEKNESVHIREAGNAVCFEIMTGAPFPKDDRFDACIKVEDTISVRGPERGSRYIQILKPAQSCQNRRLAGTDFRRGAPIITSGTTIKPHHIMALAAMGVSSVRVHRKLRIAVMSTGSELVSHENLGQLGSGKIRDSNGPYIEAVLSSMGIEVTSLGIVEDNANKFQATLSQTLSENPYDMVITSGAVSMGRYDFVGAAIQAMGANVQFHKTAIRPGAPVLFATLPDQASKFQDLNTPPDSPAQEEDLDRGYTDIAFFGLPGNPLASVVCLRFMVVPYLRALLALPEEAPSRAILRCPSLTKQSFRKPSHLQIFWHGKHLKETGEVIISSDQGSNKISPLLETDCWVGIAPGCEEVGPGDTVELYEMYPSLDC